MLNEIISVDGGAIAGEWKSNWRESGYDYREPHKERDGKIFVIRDNWALRDGLMRLARHQYMDEITKPGEEVYCRCAYRWLYTLRDLPPEMVTAKGSQKLASARAQIRRLEYAAHA